MKWQESNPGPHSFNTIVLTTLSNDKCWIVEILIACIYKLTSVRRIAAMFRSFNLIFLRIVLLTLNSLANCFLVRPLRNFSLNFRSAFPKQRWWIFWFISESSSSLILLLGFLFGKARSKLGFSLRHLERSPLVAQLNYNDTHVRRQASAIGLRHICPEWNVVQHSKKYSLKYFLWK